MTLDIDVKKYKDEITVNDLVIRLSNIPEDHPEDMQYLRDENSRAWETVERHDQSNRKKDLVIREMQNELDQLRLAQSVPGPTGPTVIEWLKNVQNGEEYKKSDKINLIKAVRLLTSMSLKDSKDLVDTYVPSATLKLL